MALPQGGEHGVKRPLLPRLEYYEAFGVRGDVLWRRVRGIRQRAKAYKIDGLLDCEGLLAVYRCHSAETVDISV